MLYLFLPEALQSEDCIEDVLNDIFKLFLCFNFEIEILNANWEANPDSLFSRYSLTARFLIFQLSELRVLTALLVAATEHRKDAHDIVSPSSSISELYAPLFIFLELYLQERFQLKKAVSERMKK